MKRLFYNIGRLSVKIFPAAGSVEYLKKLKHEADEAILAPDNLEEYSDCLLALFAAAYEAGFSYRKLLKEGRRKLKIVKKRSWTQLSDGTYQHIKK